MTFGKALAESLLDCDGIRRGVITFGVVAFGAAASYARCGSTWSITSWEAAAVRAVINVEPIPIHSVTTAMTARIHFSRAEASGSVRFFSRVISPKNTR